MTAEDRALALERLGSVTRGAFNPDRLGLLTFDGPPQAWQRAGVFNGDRIYTPKATRKAEQDLACLLKIAIPDRPWLCNIALITVFFFADHRRRDADNCMKLVMDAATKALVWHDDCQVTTQAAFVELDAARPRTVIALSPTKSSLDRTVAPRARHGGLFGLVERT